MRQMEMQQRVNKVITQKRLIIHKGLTVIIKVETYVECKGNNMVIIKLDILIVAYKYSKYFRLRDKSLGN
jgi:hypothetical protein